MGSKKRLRQVEALSAQLRDTIRAAGRDDVKIAYAVRHDGAEEYWGDVELFKTAAKHLREQTVQQAVESALQPAEGATKIVKRKRRQ